MIAVNGLHKSFAGKPVLKEIDFQIQRREVLVLIGPSGSGKSSLLRCIGGLESFQEGQIEVGGTAIRALDLEKISRPEKENLRQLRLKVGMVFQQFNLFPHMTVLGNIIEAPVEVLGLSRDEAVARATQVLDKVSLTAFMDRFPANLSGGEQQRVAIARTLAMQPECVLFDEPTSSLDPEMVGDVLAVMRTLADEGMTMMVVTHEMAFARDVADRILVLDDGRIIESGPPDKIFQSPEHDRTRQFLKRILTR